MYEHNKEKFIYGCIVYVMGAAVLLLLLARFSSNTGYVC